MNGFLFIHKSCIPGWRQLLYTAGIVVFNARTVHACSDMCEKKGDYVYVMAINCIDIKTESNN